MNEYRLKNYDGSFYVSGFMATGKSAVGKVVAKKLGVPFKDLDVVIEKKENKSIIEIFNTDGESHFRKLEQLYLLELTKTFKGVVSLGGGALQNQHIVDHLKLHGLLIYIDTPLNVILDRILRNPKRPITRDANGKIKNKEALKIELEALYSNRLKYYKQAQIKALTSGVEPKEVVANLIIQKIKTHV